MAQGNRKRLGEDSLNDQECYRTYWQDRLARVTDAPLEYHPVDALRLHPSTFEVVHRRYFILKDTYPCCTIVHQIYNTIRAYAPDLNAAIAHIQQGTKNLLVDMRTYPEEAWKLAEDLPYIAEFCEYVQETSAKLHNAESAKRANIEALNQLHMESKKREQENRLRWLAEKTAGDMYFGGPDTYQCIREEYYAETDMKKREVLRQRIRAFQEMYHTGKLVAQEQPEPVQVELWEAIA